MTNLTQDKLRSLLDYHKKTGVFTWIKSPAQCIKVGQVAGSINSSGYVLIKVCNRKYLSSRLAFYI